jgi:hypothetical protein
MPSPGLPGCATVRSSQNSGAKKAFHCLAEALRQVTLLRMPYSRDALLSHRQEGWVSAVP